METVRFEFKIDRKTWSSLDPEKDRIELAGMINDTHREAGVRFWNGSSLKGTSLVFFCMVNEELVARHTILKELGGHPLIRFLG